MKKKPTQEEINTNLEWLKANRNRVTRQNLFSGGDHRECIDVAIRVIEKNLSEDDIEDEWGVTGDLRETADYARQWLDGDESITPIDNWKGLVK